MHGCRAVFAWMCCCLCVLPHNAAPGFCTLGRYSWHVLQIAGVMRSSDTDKTRTDTPECSDAMAAVKPANSHHQALNPPQLGRGCILHHAKTLCSTAGSEPSALRPQTCT